jgi:hypothetical protein
MQYSEYLSYQKRLARKKQIDYILAKLQSHGIDKVTRQHIEDNGITQVEIYDTPEEYYSYLSAHEKIDRASYSIFPERYLVVSYIDGLEYPNIQNALLFDVTQTYVTKHKFVDEKANQTEIVLDVYPGIAIKKESDDDQLIPARNIHPSIIFFREIASVIAENYISEDNEERFAVDEEIRQFLKGGVMTESAKLAIADYFGTSPETWQNLWSNYTNHSKGSRQSYDYPSVEP